MTEEEQTRNYIIGLKDIEIKEAIEEQLEHEGMEIEEKELYQLTEEYKKRIFTEYVNRMINYLSETENDFWVECLDDAVRCYFDEIIKKLDEK